MVSLNRGRRSGYKAPVGRLHLLLSISKGAAVPAVPSPNGTRTVPLMDGHSSDSHNGRRPQSLDHIDRRAARANGVRSVSKTTEDRDQLQSCLAAEEVRVTTVLKDEWGQSVLQASHRPTDISMLNAFFVATLSASPRRLLWCDAS